MTPDSGDTTAMAHTHMPSSPAAPVRAARVLLVEALGYERLITCLLPNEARVVAAAVGFGSAHALRHHFRRKVGLTPTEYRSRFLKVERQERSVGAALHPV